jgi:hypothetical protein
MWCSQGSISIEIAIAIEIGIAESRPPNHGGSRGARVGDSDFDPDFAPDRGATSKMRLPCHYPRLAFRHRFALL